MMLLKAVFFVELFAQILIFEPQLTFLQSLANHERQFDQLERLGQIVVGALLDRGDGGFDRAVTGDDDADDFRISNQRFFQKLDAGLSRKIVIGDENVIGCLRQFLDGFFGGHGLIHLKSFKCQIFRRSLCEVLFVVNYQNLFSASIHQRLLPKSAARL